MALRFTLQGSRVRHSAHLNVGLWGLLNQNLWNPTSSSSSSSCYVHHHGSSIPNRLVDEIKTQDESKAFLGGTSIYKGAHKDEWIISLAKFAVNKQNENEGSRVRHSAHLNVGLWGLLNQNLWNPTSSSSSSSCYVHHHGSSIPNRLVDEIKTQDESKAFLGGTSIYKGAHKDEWIISLAKFAVNKQNENEKDQLRFARVVGASHTGSSNLLYHITLEATDAHMQKIYHAVVWLQLWRNLMDLLVWRRVNDALSAVGVKRGN
ncbi:unnamed protein product [Ilex paraguariensis]|uniref:Cysteine proteinase inhibitor n=1 Tax=Ilex paraguariensis TaxID=185542 RepID=A0ABC8R9T1_9AQUA